MIRQLAGFPGLFDDLGLIGRDWDRLFEPWGRPASIRAAARGAFPMVNVGTDAHAMHVYALLPGIDPGKLDVSLQDKVLTISGERAAAEAGRNAYLQERFSGPFKRTITLPDDIDSARVDANYRDGVLHIRIDRREESKPRRIEVR